MKKLSVSTPVVFVQVADPISQGFVESISKPNGNMTGFGRYEYSIAEKWVEILRELRPSLSRLMVLYDPSQPASLGYINELSSTCAHSDIDFSANSIQSEFDVRGVFSSVATGDHSSMIILSGPRIYRHRALITQLALSQNLPLMHDGLNWVRTGGLISYGDDTNQTYGRSAEYIEKILKGMKPGDLPIQYATKLEMAINLGTARKMGLAIPFSLLSRADEVIE